MEGKLSRAPPGCEAAAGLCHSHLEHLDLHRKVPSSAFLYRCLGPLKGTSSYLDSGVVRVQGCAVQHSPQSHGAANWSGDVR